MIVQIQKSTARGSVSAPPSNSMGHRLLICAALSEGESRVRGISDSGSLLVTDQGGQDRELWAGEVSIGATDPASPFYKS